MKFEVMTITPDMAKAMLQSNIRNRKISHGTIEAYSQDMLSGNWGISHQGIAFNPDGKLMDGQHRLLAIIKSGIPVQMLVCTDVPLTYNIDNGRRRTPLNQLTMRGSVVSEQLINSQNISVARFYMIRNKSKITITTAQLEQFMFDHENAFIALQECTSGNNKLRGVSISPVHYALFAALVNGVESGTVKRLYELLVSGIGNGSDLDNMVIRQRNILMNIASAKSVPRGSYEEITKKMQKLIELFANGKAMKSIYTPSQDIYPV